MITTGNSVSGAVFSDCERYRYRLWRTWANYEGPSRACFVMLNPSTADASVDDPTIRRCMGFAMRWEFDGLEVVNLFALRSTDPKALYREIDPVGCANDAAIGTAAHASELVVCAWGAHGSYNRRGDVVRQTLTFVDLKPMAFGFTKAGQPKHPLYLRSDSQLVAMEGA